jgi:hypothetical protein
MLNELTHVEMPVPIPPWEQPVTTTTGLSDIIQKVEQAHFDFQLKAKGNSADLLQFSLPRERC